MIKYRLTKVDGRYDRISEIGNNDWPDAHDLTDEPFDTNNFELFRWDKNIGAWVEGIINEETGEWELKT